MGSVPPQTTCPVYVRASSVWRTILLRIVQTVGECLAGIEDADLCAGMRGLESVSLLLEVGIEEVDVLLHLGSVVVVNGKRGTP